MPRSIRRCGPQQKYSSVTASESLAQPSGQKQYEEKLVPRLRLGRALSLPCSAGKGGRSTGTLTRNQKDRRLFLIGSENAIEKKKHSFLNFPKMISRPALSRGVNRGDFLIFFYGNQSDARAPDWFSAIHKQQHPPVLRTGFFSRI